ncbi:hypothetical protein [uncultured Friedmanniella sp.]
MSIPAQVETPEMLEVAGLQLADGAVGLTVASSRPTCWPLPPPW